MAGCQGRARRTVAQAHKKLASRVAGTGTREQGESGRGRGGKSHLACCSDALGLAGGNPGRLAGGGEERTCANPNPKPGQKKDRLCSQLARHKALCMRPASWPSRTASALTQCPVAVPRTSTRFARARRHYSLGKGEESTALFKEAEQRRARQGGRAGGSAAGRT